MLGWRPMRAASAPARPAIEWLDREPEFSALATRLAELVEIQRLLRSAWPSTPLEALAISAGTLVLAARHAAQAARLRQSTPSLLRALSAHGAAVERIEIRVLRPDLTIPAARDPRPRAPIPAQALADLERLGQQVRGSTRLAHTLKRLGERRRGAAEG